MKLQLSEKQRTTGILIIRTFTICLLIGIAVLKFPELTAILKKIIAVLSPIIWGLVLAYLLSPIQSWTEEKCKRFLEKKKPHPVLSRVISVSCCVLFLVLLLTGLTAMLLPELYSSLKSLLTSLPDYMSSATKWIGKSIEGLEEDQPQLYAFFTTSWDNLQSKLSSFTSELQPMLETLSGGADIISTITSGAFSIMNALKNFLLGIFVAIYLLYNKETHQAQVKKFLYAFLPGERVGKLLRIGSHVSYSFMHFLAGKTLDSFIIGMLCFVGMTILDMPYISLISLIIGVTNIIPFFGPFIGAIPCGVLILLSTPSKVIPFVIFILVLQQFDGNILGPKILGGSLGLPTFWILFAIFVGGGLFGFIGMVAFVPLFAALYTFVSEFLAERLHAKGLPCDTEAYMGIEPPQSFLTDDEPDADSDDDDENTDDDNEKKPESEQDAESEETTA